MNEEKRNRKVYSQIIERELIHLIAPSRKLQEKKVFCGQGCLANVDNCIPLMSTSPGPTIQKPAQC